MTFTYSRDNDVGASSQAQLEFSNTYFLAYRDLLEIISKHITGKQALDFGCGAGRSTRYLKNIAFEIFGIERKSEATIASWAFAYGI